MKNTKTKEKQLQICFDYKEKYGLQHLGIISNHTWLSDPKRLLFVLSRYKFVAKMLSGLDRVLEIGCGDGFGTYIVNQEVGLLTAVDYDPAFISDAKNNRRKEQSITFQVHDILKGPVKGNFNGAYALDVIEHIARTSEDVFIKNIIESITKDGTLIVGTPSIESQNYASKESREGHINCKNSQDLKKLLKKYFHNVFIFSMNDEVVHTGFYSMAHYLFALCCYPISK